MSKRMQVVALVLGVVVLVGGALGVWYIKQRLDQSDTGPRIEPSAQVKSFVDAKTEEERDSVIDAIKKQPVGTISAEDAYLVTVWALERRDQQTATTYLERLDALQAKHPGYTGALLASGRPIISVPELKKQLQALPELIKGTNARSRGD